MLRPLLAACAALALLQTQALAGAQYLGTIAMYVCDGGEDLCSNTLTSSPIDLPIGPFTEDFVFDFVNDFRHVPDDVPLLKATALLETSDQGDFSAASVTLHDHSGAPFGFELHPFVPNGSNYYAQNAALIYPGTGYSVEVSGVSNSPRLPLQVSVNAFDLGPIIVPEPSTWAMMLLGIAGLGFAARRRTRSTPAIGKPATPPAFAGGAPPPCQNPVL
jgi:hypothetical protein